MSHDDKKTVTVTGQNHNFYSKQANKTILTIFKVILVFFDQKISIFWHQNGLYPK
jgi:hypothetical protein